MKLSQVFTEEHEIDINHGARMPYVTKHIYVYHTAKVLNFKI